MSPWCAALIYDVGEVESELRGEGSYNVQNEGKWKTSPDVSCQEVSGITSCLKDELPSSEDVANIH